MSGIKDYICQEQKESHALLEWRVSRSQASSRSRTRCNQEDGLLLSCERFLAVGLRAFLPFYFLKLLTRFRVKNFPSSYELSEVLIDVSIFLAVTLNIFRCYCFAAALRAEWKMLFGSRCFQFSWYVGNLGSTVESFAHVALFAAWLVRWNCMQIIDRPPPSCFWRRNLHISYSQQRVLSF